LSTDRLKERGCRKSKDNAAAFGLECIIEYLAYSKAEGGVFHPLFA
jgi:hypothetical protein